MPTLLGTDWGHSHIRGPVPTPAHLLSLAKGSPHMWPWFGGQTAFLWFPTCRQQLMRTEAMGMSEFAHLEWRDERKGNQKGSSRILKEKLSHGDQTEGASGHQYQMSPPARTSLKSTGKEMSIMCHNWGVISHFEGNGEEKELGFAGWGLNRNWSK